ncbi:MAG: hypothetical protein ACKVE4_04050 [Dissulfuribacterales bacterium]
MSKAELETAFTPTFIGEIELKNRFIRSATWDGMVGENGEISPWQTHLYQTLSS